MELNPLWTNEDFQMLPDIEKSVSLMPLKTINVWETLEIFEDIEDI